MALPPLADVAALDAWLPGVAIVGDEAAEQRAEAVLAAASATVRAQRGETWVVDDALIEDIPDEVGVLVVQLAAKMWANPTGLTQETVGPFSASHGQSLLTDDEIGLLPGGTGPGGLGSIQVEAPAETRLRPPRWCEEDW